MVFSWVFIGNAVRCLHPQASCVVFIGFIRMSSLEILSCVFIGSLRPGLVLCIHRQSCSVSSSASFAYLYNPILCIHQQFCSVLHWHTSCVTPIDSPRSYSLLGLHSHVFIGEILSYIFTADLAIFSSLAILSCVFISNLVQRLHRQGRPRAWSSRASFACLHRKSCSAPSSAVRVHGSLHRQASCVVFIDSPR